MTKCIYKKKKVYWWENFWKHWKWWAGGIQTESLLRPCVCSEPDCLLSGAWPGLTWTNTHRGQAFAVPSKPNTSQPYMCLYYLWMKGTMQKNWGKIPLKTLREHQRVVRKSEKTSREHFPVGSLRGADILYNKDDVKMEQKTPDRITVSLGVFYACQRWLEIQRTLLAKQLVIKEGSVMVNKKSRNEK